MKRFIFSKSTIATFFAVALIGGSAFAGTLTVTGITGSMAGTSVSNYNINISTASQFAAAVTDAVDGAPSGTYQVSYADNENSGEASVAVNGDSLDVTGMSYGPTTDCGHLIHCRTPPKGQ